MIINILEVNACFSKNLMIFQCFVRGSMAYAHSNGNETIKEYNQTQLKIKN